MKRLLACALLGLVGCTKPSAPPAAGQLTALPPSHPALTPLPDPDSSGGHVGRAPRRLTAAQLKQSIAVTTQETWSQMDALAASLGAADFALVNAEATEPNLVFAKFLEDGAREVCLEAARADLTRAPADRVLSPGLTATADFTASPDAEVQANLAFLALRFWGAAMDAEELAADVAAFKALAASAKRANKPEQAWGSVCVAMMTDPRFFTY